MSAYSPTDDGGDDKQPKRMRLGTKSCAECRRRKVRCIFPDQNPACDSCVLHSVPCKPQQPKQGGKRKTQDEGLEKAALQERLEELEGVVRQLCGAMDLDAASATIGQLKTGTAEAVRRMHASSESESTSSFLGPTRNVSPGTTTGTRTTAPESTQTVNSIDTPEQSSDEGEEYTDAPLITLFRDAMLLCSGPAEQADEPQLTTSTGRQVSGLVGAVTHLIPAPEDLVSIFETTSKCWAMWPACYHGSGPADTLQLGGPSASLNFLSRVLPSGDATAVAKALLWLTLCLQQLPNSWTNSHPNLPAAPRVLIASYLQASSALVSIVTDHGDTLETVECELLTSKIYFDMGRPRKSWLSARRALNAALLLGLQHAKTTTSDDRRRCLWSSSWQLECQVSCLLGLPSAMPEGHPGLARELVGAEPIGQLYHGISIVAGAIIKRDQHPDTTNYSDTVQLDQDWERMKHVMPPDFWVSQSSSDLPFSVLFYRQAAKIHYFILGKLIHLPYMLKARTEPKFELSRTAGLFASREAIHVYRLLRARIEAGIMFCEELDFQAFSAGCCIAVSWLSMAACPTSWRDPGQEASDWALVDSLAVDLKRIASVMECSVARQGAQVLEFLSMIRRGTYNGPEKFDVVIPYFGRVTVSSSNIDFSGGQALPSPAAMEPTGLAIASPTFQFSSLGLPYGYGPEEELQSDWAAHFDLQNYDWADVFQFDGL